MSFVKTANNFVDSAVAVFSPRAAVKRKVYRNILAGKNDQSSRSAKYAAAKLNRLTGDYFAPNVNVNDVIGASSPRVRQSVQQLVRDFPFFAKAVNAVCEYTVGSGIMYQARVERPNGELDLIMNNALEDSFKFWADEADIAGQLHFYEMQDLSKRQELECGEYIFVKHNQKRLRGQERYIPYCLQMIEPTWLTSSNITGQAKSKNVTIDQGIEYNVNTGEIIAYHFTDPDAWGRSTRVTANRVIHGFQTKRPGQLRGISPFTPAVLITRDLQDYIDAEVDGMKMASKWLAFIKTPDIAARTDILTPGTGEDQGKKIDEIENAILEYLSPGEEVTLSSNPRPGDNFGKTIGLLLRMVAVTVDLPYELISMDYQGLSWSTGRMVRTDFSHALKPYITRHLQKQTLPAFNDFMDVINLYNRVPMPGYANNPWQYKKSEWQPPGMDAVDPLRETKSSIDQMNKLLKSPQEHAKARGRDYETILKEIAQAKALQEKYGVTEKEVSTSVANNPAAVTDQKGAVVDFPKKNSRLK